VGSIPAKSHSNGISYLRPTGRKRFWATTDAHPGNGFNV
jgi:hypothetical protein